MFIQNYYLYNEGHLARMLKIFNIAHYPESIK